MAEIRPLSHADASDRLFSTHRAALEAGNAVVSITRKVLNAARNFTSSMDKYQGHKGSFKLIPRLAASVAVSTLTATDRCRVRWGERICYAKFGESNCKYSSIIKEQR